MKHRLLGVGDPDALPLQSNGNGGSTMSSPQGRVREARGRQ